jgi:hypothetical protein
MATTKKEVKKVLRARREKKKAAKEPLVVNVAVESTLSAVSEAKIDVLRAEMAQLREAQRKDPGEKQLHRRVLVLVYDAAGVRIANTSYDLMKDDTLALSVDAESVRATTASASR